MQDSFSALGVSARIVGALERRGIHAPFAVQNLVLPDALGGVDVLAASPTGSGRRMKPSVTRSTLLPRTRSVTRGGRASPRWSRSAAPRWSSSAHPGGRGAPRSDASRDLAPRPPRWGHPPMLTPGALPG